MIQDEFARFLSAVNQAFDAYPHDLLQSIHAAVRNVLEMALDNALLRAVVSATHGADTELLPRLTTHAQPLLSTAKTVTADRLAPLALPLDERQISAAVDVLVRAVLSHVMQSTGTAQQAAEDIAWVVARVLQPDK